MRVGQTTFVSFVSKTVTSAAGFVATILFARILGADILGEYYVLLSIVAWLSLFGSVGIGSALKKRLSEGEDIGEYKLAGAMIFASVGGLIVFGIIIFQDYVTRYFGIEQIDLVVLLVIIGLSGSYVEALLDGRHLVHVNAILKVIRRITRTGLQVAGVLLGFGLLALVLGYAFGGLVLVVGGLYIVGRPYRFPTRNHIEHLIDYAKYAWIGRLEGKTFKNADILVLGLFVPSSLVGVYGITWSIANFLIIFSTSISRSMFPELSMLSTRNQESQVSTLIEDALSYAGLFTIPGFIGGVLLSDRILQFYGEEFQAGTQILGLLILSVLLYGYQKQLTNTLGGIDHPEEAFKVNGSLIVSNISLNFILVYYFETVGAAFASVISVLVSLGIGYRLLNHYLEFRPPIGQIGRQLTAAISMGLLLIVLKPVAYDVTHSFSETVVTVGLIIVGACTYFAVLFMISPDIRSVVTENLPG